MPLALLADALRVRRREPPRVQYCSFWLDFLARLFFEPDQLGDVLLDFLDVGTGRGLGLHRLTQVLFS
jgi:hypothetical protein